MIGMGRTRNRLLVGGVALFGVALSGLGATNALPAPVPAHEIFQWRLFLAPFHSVFLHYPIGFVTLAAILEVYHWRRPSAELRGVIALIMLLSVASTAVVVGLGIFRASGGGYDEATLALHRKLGLITGILLLGTLTLQRFAYRRQDQKALQAGYRFLLAGTLAALVLAGHEGGNLTHGSKYLVENAPEFVRTLFEPPAEERGATAAAGTGGDRLFTERIQPIFAAKCVKCHGSEKQKGHYRLDTELMAIKGGESGEPPIKFGEPMQSLLARRILLPKDHDEVMPPEGKEALTPDEILTIVHWIQTGTAPAAETASRQTALSETSK